MSSWRSLARLAWSGSLRTRLVVGVAGVHAVMMTLFIIDFVGRQELFLDETTQRRATGLAEAVAASSPSWVLAHDSEGLAEVVGGVTREPGVVEAMVLSPELRVLAHSDAKRVGAYLTDRLSLGLKAPGGGARVLGVRGGAIDAVAPVVTATGRALGWARVSVSTADNEVAMQIATRDGVVYVGFAILVGVGFALLLAHGLTRDLRRLADTAERVRRGETVRSFVVRADELGRLATGVNAMLDAIVAARRRDEERAVLEIQLRQAQKVEALGRLAGGVAHDFNNMLTAILAHAELARETASEPQIRSDLDAIISAARRAAGVAGQVLAFSRGRAAQPSPIDLGAVVAEVKLLVRPMLSGVTLEVDAPEDRYWVVGERSGLVQVLMNLCVNAIHALAGRGRIQVALLSGQVEGTCASCHEHFAAELSEVRVCDDGPGIPAESLPRIFEPFYSTRGGQGGSGLGLSVVHGLVHGWGGHILVERDGGTTRFRVLLPATTPAVEAALRPSLPAVTGPIGRLLLVDDEPLVGQSMARVLRRRGWAVTFEGDGASALARAAQEAFDVVLTDYSMPGMNGLELARALKESGFSAPILLMTGNPGDVPASTDIVMVLAKPPDLDELAALLAVHGASRP